MEAAQEAEALDPDGVEPVAGEEAGDENQAETWADDNGGVRELRAQVKSLMPVCTHKLKN